MGDLKSCPEGEWGPFLPPPFLCPRCPLPQGGWPSRWRGGRNGGLPTGLAFFPGAFLSLLKLLPSVQLALEACR